MSACRVSRTLKKAVQQGRREQPLLKGWLGRSQLRETLSPAHPVARRDVPYAQTRAVPTPSISRKGSGRGCPLLHASSDALAI